MRRLKPKLRGVEAIRSDLQVWADRAALAVALFGVAPSGADACGAVGGLAASCAARSLARGGVMGFWDFLAAHPDIAHRLSWAVSVALVIWAFNGPFVTFKSIKKGS